MLDAYDLINTEAPEYRQYREQLWPLAVKMRKAALPLLHEFFSYGELVAALPKERTPMGEVLSSPDVKDDIRVKAMVDGYVKATCKKEQLKGGDRAEFTKDVYRDLHRAVREVILEQLQEDSGYREQMARDAVLSLLLHLFRSSSQSTGQTQSRRDLLKQRSRELSDTALRDRRKQQEQAGNWAPEL